MFFKKEKTEEGLEKTQTSYRLVNQPNGDIYEGYLKDDKFNGLGTLYYTNKCFYKGYFKDGEKERGLETFPNGDEYTGVYKKNKFHGEGILENKRLCYKYEGEFKNGEKEGKGTEKYKNGTVYAGEFKRNMRNGKGKLSKLDGKVYEGHFFDGMEHGYGVLIERNKALKKTEEQAPNDDKSMNEIFYEGEFCFGYKHGIGRYYLEKGSYIYGEWRFDKSFGFVLTYFAEENSWQLSFFDISELETVIKKGHGIPHSKFDAYKSVIEECGVKNEKIEDLSFPSSIESLGIKIPNSEDFNFCRISELYKKEKYELFSEVIKPGRFFVSSSSSLREITIIDALCYYPHLILNMFTPKYSLDIGYFILKLYVDGAWREVFVDDFIPCIKSQTMLCTNFKEDIGWLVLQKAIAKIKRTYFAEKDHFRITEDLLKLLTALPMKSVPCSNIRKVLKCLEKRSENKVKLVHLKEEFYENYKIPKNMPFILTDYVKVNEQQGIFIIRTLENELKIPDQMDLTSVNTEYFELLKNHINIDDAHYHTIEQNIFKDIFSDVSILLGTENLIQNTAKFFINVDAKEDFSESDTFTFDFKITVSSKVLINIDQVVHAEENLYPLRMNLVKLKEVVGNKKQANGNIQKKPKYTYIFGKGQLAKKDLHKELFLECGTYVLFLEFEVNPAMTIEKRFFNVNIFSPFLLKINRRANNPSFKKKIYKDIMNKSYLVAKENREIKNFTLVDLRDKINGSEHLIIMQYFLKKEGTYLHYLMNNSKNRRWKQKISFKLENMKIINDFDSNDVELLLDPGKKVLIIIQQTQGLNYGLEGGDGPCMIQLITEEQLLKEKSPTKIKFNVDAK